MKEQAAQGARAALVPFSHTINLGEIAQRLARALLADSHGPLFSVSNNRLLVNPRSVMIAFYKSLQDKPLDFLENPPLGFDKTILLGTGVSTKSHDVSDNVVHLRNAISEALNLALQFKPQLIAPTTRAWIDACSLTEDFPSSLPKTAKIVAAAYAPADKAAVAKTISTIEKIDSVVWLEILTKNIANVIKAIATSNDQTITDADIARISTRLHADASGQIGEFLQFLEDGALSRARLHVACELLTAIAANGDSHLKNYTARINAARAIFAAPGAEALILDASKAYGANGVADLTFSLNTTGFYDCLPIWIRPNAQIFEQRFDANLSSEREITYKLRLNGFKHAGRESKTAFEGELKALRTILSANEGNDKTRRAISEAFFLFLVVGETPPDDFKATAHALAARLEAAPQATISEILDHLDRTKDKISKLATQTIRILRERPLLIAKSFQNQSLEVSVAIDRSILKRSALFSEEDILRTRDDKDPNLSWYEYVSTSTLAAPSPHALLSFVAHYRLAEWSIAETGTTETTSFERQFEAPLLPIRFRPYKRKNNDYFPAYPDEEAAFNAPFGVEIAYSDGMLNPVEINRKNSGEENKPYPAHYTAFCLLIETILVEIIKFAKTNPGAESLHVILARLQNDARHSASDPLYALTQGLERNLGHLAPVKLQGLIQNDQPMQDGARTHRQQAALAASLTSLPLKFPVQEPPTKIALIAYTTRPCDESHKMLLQRIYTLSPVDDATSGDPAAILAYQGAQTRVLDDGDAKGASDALFDAIGKLDQADYRHILLLSHDYGNRRRGRASARHAPHASAAFFKRLAENHPDVCFYPLRRDIFPAIRLRRRNKQEESAYEIADYKSHSLLQKAIGGAMLRALLPIYSFATLDLVGREDHRPYSGICCYFFDTVTADEQPVTAEVARQNILGVGIGPHIAIRKSIISLLRGLHFLESEKPGVNGDLLLPVLDPLDWATPKTLTAFGEIQLDLSRRKKARLSTAALLSQVANILARDDYKP